MQKNDDSGMLGVRIPVRFCVFPTICSVFPQFAAYFHNLQRISHNLQFSRGKNRKFLIYTPVLQCKTVILQRICGYKNLYLKRIQDFLQGCSRCRYLSTLNSRQHTKSQCHCRCNHERRSSAVLVLTIMIMVMTVLNSRKRLQTDDYELSGN